MFVFDCFEHNYEFFFSLCPDITLLCQACFTKFLSNFLLTHGIIALPGRGGCAAAHGEGGRLGEGD